MVLDQWFQRRHSFETGWAIGRLFNGRAAGTEFLGSAFGWNEALYRTWYLIGAFLVPAYLGAGTLYLLNKTRFGYFAAASIGLGGLFSALAIARYPGSAAAGYTTLAVALTAAAAIAIATTMRRALQAHVAIAFLVAGPPVVAGLFLGRAVARPSPPPTAPVP